MLRVAIISYLYFIIIIIFFFFNKTAKHISDKGLCGVNRLQILGRVHKRPPLLLHQLRIHVPSKPPFRFTNTLERLIEFIESCYT